MAASCRRGTLQVQTGGKIYSVPVLQLCVSLLTKIYEVLGHCPLCFSHDPSTPSATYTTKAFEPHQSALNKRTILRKPLLVSTIELE